MLLRCIALVYCLFIHNIVFSEEEEDFPISPPEHISALKSAASDLIAGVISPMSGQPVLRQMDLVAKGAQNVTLSRIYLAPWMPVSFPKHKHHPKKHEKKYLAGHLQVHYKGWQFYPHLQLHSYRECVRLTEPSGSTIEFRLSENQTQLSSPSYGINNVSGGRPQASADPRNIRITPSDCGKKLIVSNAN